MNGESTAGAAVTLILMAGSFILGGCIGKDFEAGNTRRLQREAVERGAAEWVVVIGKDGTPSPEFRWKEQPKKESAK